MKTLLCKLLIVLLFFLPLSCGAATKTVTASWYQTIADTTKFGGWEIHIADKIDGPYTVLTTVPFVTVQPVYGAKTQITVTGGKVTTKYLKALAFNKNGKKSEFSNVSILIIRTSLRGEVPVILETIINTEK